MRDHRQGSNEDETPDGIEKILRALAGQDPEDGLPAPDDQRLHAYREGSLSPEETRELEGLLARSAAGRRRLLELAGIDRSLPLRRVRKAVLDGAARRRGVAPWMAAAAAVAAIAAMIVVALIVVLPRQSALPERLAYDISARGLAEVRSGEQMPGEKLPGEDVPGETRAYPATPVRISLRPRGDSPAGLSFTLFRREGGALRQVRQPDEVRLESDRGSATFAGSAARMLATQTPGVYPLYIVISRKELPSWVDLEPGQDPASALRGSGRLVYPVTVTLLQQRED